MTNTFEMKQQELVLTVISVESLLFTVASAWGYFAHINPFHKIQFNTEDIILAVLNSFLLLAVNFLVINVFSKYIPFFRYLKEAYDEITPIAANITFPGAFIIAVFSGFAEEFLFRGIIQIQFGIIIASVLFGLFHIGSKKTLWYGIYAVIIGFYLGLLYHITGNLLVTIIVHCLNNFLALYYMRYYYRKYIKNSNYE